MTVHLDIEADRKGKPIRIFGTVENQFALAGDWLRGNLHCHLEEGRWVDSAAAIYRDIGYDFLAGMDHDKCVPPDDPGELLVVPGAEMSPGHLLVFGLEDVSGLRVQAKDRASATAEIISLAKQQGAVAFLAHPFWGGWSWEELRLLCDAGLDGMEVVNSSKWKVGDTIYSDQMWHLMLDKDTFLAATGGDDAHGPAGVADGEGMQAIARSRLGWTGVLATDRSVEGVLDALGQGRTYASEGPEFRSIEMSSDGKLTVRCSPCVACHFRGRERGYGGRSSFAPDEQGVAEDFVFDFAINGYRVRDHLIVVLEDEMRRKAWLSPLRLDLSIESR